MRRAGVLLAGGSSERMGVDKAALVWRGAPLLLHVLAALRAGLASADEHPPSEAPLVVVRAPGRPLPSLPDGVEVVEDAVAGVGPLRGLRDGLAALGERADAAFVAATDLPLLRPAFVRHVLDAVEEVDAAVPSTGGRLHPLAAAYRVSVVQLADGLLAHGERRVAALVDACDARLLDGASLRRVDPELASLVNVNTPADLAGLPDA